MKSILTHLFTAGFFFLSGAIYYRYIVPEENAFWWVATPVIITAVAGVILGVLESRKEKKRQKGS